MTRHSSTFNKQKEELNKKQEEIRQQLAKESQETEEEIFNYLKLFGIAAAVAISLYGITKLVKGKSKKKNAKEEDLTSQVKRISKKVKGNFEPEPQSAQQYSFKNQLLEKVSDQLVAAAASFVSGYLTRWNASRKNAKTETKD